MNDKRIRQYEVQVNEDNMRLDEYLSYKIARFSRTQASRCIKGGGVSIEPFRVPKPSLKIHAGDVISIAQTMCGDVPMYDAVSLIAETDAFWVFNKPAGMAVHPTANIYHNTLTHYVETQLNAKAYVVHRLDKETSGAILMAKRPDVSRSLDDLFLSREVNKIYEAVIYNARSFYYPGKVREIDIPLGFAGRVLPKITMGIGDLEAFTRIECMSIHDDFAWCRVNIHSGRQHQIRAHLALDGTPVIGDKLYLFGEAFYKSWLDGDEVPLFSPGRQLLHASKLQFEWGGHRYEYEAPVPDVMHEVFRGSRMDSMFPTDYSKLYLG